jgi:hypothetical protein
MIKEYKKLLEYHDQIMVLIEVDILELTANFKLVELRDKNAQLDEINKNLEQWNYLNNIEESELWNFYNVPIERSEFEALEKFSLANK